MALLATHLPAAQGRKRFTENLVMARAPWLAKGNSDGGFLGRDGNRGPHTFLVARQRRREAGQALGRAPRDIFCTNSHRRPVFACAQAMPGNLVNRGSRWHRTDVGKALPLAV